MANCRPVVVNVLQTSIFSAARCINTDGRPKQAVKRTMFTSETIALFYVDSSGHRMDCSLVNLLVWLTTFRKYNTLFSRLSEILLI